MVGVRNPDRARHLCFASEEEKSIPSKHVELVSFYDAFKKFLTLVLHINLHINL